MSREDKFCSSVITITASQCHSCKHYHENLACDAYPEGIPEKILVNEIKHDKALAGDHGIRYEAMDAK